MREQKFYRCSHCGNLVAMMHSSGARIVCCGEEMKLLDANTQDGAREKHLPLVHVDGCSVRVQVGDVIHPMTEAHYIQWIYLETEKGGQVKFLKPNEEPTAKFKVVDDEVVAVYEYCNLHGLYKTVIKG
ncbi:MAG: desulfoferrodoxin family protein [Bacilli bacterium]